MKNVKINKIVCLSVTLIMLLGLSCLTAYASDGKFSEDDESPEHPMSPDDYENHTHDFSIWRDIPGTDNIHVRHCVCGASEHGECSYDNGVITRQPTVDTEGVKTYTCKDCGGKKTEKIDKLASDKTNQGEGDKNNNDKSNAWIIPLVIAIVAASGVAVLGVLIYKKKSAEKNIDKSETSNDTKEEVNEEN